MEHAVQATPRILLLLKDLEQSEILKAIGLSQGFEVRVLEYRSRLPRELISAITDEVRPTLAIVELEYLHHEGVAPDVLVNMMTAAHGKAQLLLSQSQQLVVRGAQAQWAKDHGAIGLLPSLSSHRLHEQIAEHLAPAFAIWNQTVNWARAQSFASMVPAGLGRATELKNAHRLLAELNSRAISLKQLAHWAREQKGFDVADRRWRLNTYPKVFIGAQAVLALQAQLACDKDKALRVGDLMRIAGHFSHVSHAHDFDDGDFYYRFYEPGESARRVRLIALVKQLVAPNGVSIKDRQFLGTVYPVCTTGCEMVAWLTGNLRVSEDEAVQLGQYLLELGLLQHVTSEHRFRNAELFYQFRGLAARQLKQARSKQAAGQLSSGSMSGSAIA